MASPDIIAVVSERICRQALDFLDEAIRTDPDGKKYTGVPFIWLWQAEALQRIRESHTEANGESYLSVDSAVQLLDEHLLRVDPRGLTAEQISELASFSTDLRKQLIDVS